MLENEPLVTIVVPSFNGANDLNTCLTAVFDNNLDGVDVIVVNDGSETPSIKEVAENFDVLYVESKVNVGRGPARNLGASQAKGQYLLFLDADVALPPTALSELKSLLIRRPEINALFGSYDDTPSAPGAVSQYRNLLHHFTHQNSGDVAIHFWTGYGVIKTSVFRTIGGFNEGKWARNMEEVELGLRITREGHPIYVFKDLQAKHLKSYSLISMIRSDLFERAIPWTLFLLENRPPKNEFVTSSHQRFSALAALAIPTAALFPLFGTPALWISLSGLFIFILVNGGFFRFCWRVRGFGFMATSILLHAVHMNAAILGFGIGTVKFLLQKKSKKYVEERGSSRAFRRDRVNW